MKNTIYIPVLCSERLPAIANENYLTISERGIETSRFFNGKKFESAHHEGEIVYWLEKRELKENYPAGLLSSFESDDNNPF